MMKVMIVIMIMTDDYKNDWDYDLDAPKSLNQKLLQLYSNTMINH